MKKYFYILFFLFELQLLNAQVKTMDIDLENYEYPFPVKFITLPIQQEKYKMAYMDVKPETPNGKTIVLLHGKNFNGAYWKQTTDTLISKGFRVIIPDQLGFGKSSKPQFFQYSFQQLAANTKKLLDTLGIKNYFIHGHSMGGMLAIRFTLMYPESVIKLSLEDPIGLEDYKLKVPYQTIDSLYKKELKQTYESLKKYEQTSYYNNTWKPEYDEWLNVIAGWTLNKDYAKIAWNNALTTDMIMNQPVVYELENIKVPVLLIIGENDHTAIGKDLVKKEVQQTMGNFIKLGIETKIKLSNCQLIRIEDTGHLPHIQSFTKFIIPLEEFLNN